jgi:hypothetical protein
MPTLPAGELQKLGISPTATVSQLHAVQVRKLIAACSRAGAVKFGGHSEDKLVERGGSRDDVYDALEQGGIVPGKTEPSNGGGLKMQLRHLYCGEQFNVVVALDVVEGPAFVVTIWFEA